MKFSFLSLLAIIGLTACLPSAKATPVVGEPAPEFTAIDTNGVERSLKDFRGKNVVLEWSNHQCPFVLKHYSVGNMQKLQKQATENGAVWLTIVSSAKGKQGHVTADEANEIIKEVGAHSTARILDETGEIGRLYDAKTTPHMFIIDKNGVLAYAGAIDSNASTQPSTIDGATNYISAALAELNAGKPVTTASTKPYGCGIKY